MMSVLNRNFKQFAKKRRPLTRSRSDFHQPQPPSSSQTSTPLHHQLSLRGRDELQIEALDEDEASSSRDSLVFPASLGLVPRHQLELQQARQRQLQQQRAAAAVVAAASSTAKTSSSEAASTPGKVTAAIDASKSSGELNKPNLSISPASLLAQSARLEPSHQREFRCRFCGKGYRWKSTMRRHESLECGDKPPSFQCSQCPYKARQRGNLTVHFKRHHQNVPGLKAD
ncbi:hypothetical protein TKK_0011303 [Trichogramma kaykai]